MTVEAGEGAGEADRAALAGRVSQALKAELNFTARVNLVPAGAIPRTEMGKAIRVKRDY